MNSRVQNLLIILTLVSMESSHLVIFSTSGKFIRKFNVLRCINLSETLFWTGARGGIPITLTTTVILLIFYELLYESSLKFVEAAFVFLYGLEMEILHVYVVAWNSPKFPPSTLKF